MRRVQVEGYEPGQMDRTGLIAGSADSRANPYPSEMDVKKPACASEFQNLIEGWIGELSISSLCKVSSFPHRRSRKPPRF